MEKVTSTYDVRLFSKHFCTSLLLGGLPSIILYMTNTRTIFFKEINRLIPGNVLQWYFIGAFIQNIVLSGFVYFIELSYPAKQIIVFIRDVVKETASGLRSIIQTMTGAIYVFCLFWHQLEPKSFTIMRWSYFLLYAFLFTFASATLEVVEQYFERKKSYLLKV